MEQRSRRVGYLISRKKCLRLRDLSASDYRQMQDPTILEHAFLDNVEDK